MSGPERRPPSACRIPCYVAAIFWQLPSIAHVLTLIVVSSAPRLCTSQVTRCESSPLFYYSGEPIGGHCWLWALTGGAAVGSAKRWLACHSKSRTATDSSLHSLCADWIKTESVPIYSHRNFVSTFILSQTDCVCALAGKQQQWCCSQMTATFKAIFFSPPHLMDELDCLILPQQFLHIHFNLPL